MLLKFSMQRKVENESETWKLDSMNRRAALMRRLVVGVCVFESVWSCGETFGLVC